MHVAGRNAAAQAPNTNCQKDISMGHESRSKITRHLVAGAVAALAAGAMPAAHAEVELGKGFSVMGFADMSAYSFNPKGGSTTDSAGIDQFETDFLFAGSNGISAEVDVEYGENFEGSGDTTFVEQAFVTKAFTDQFSVKFGRFLSYSGWEAEEPTGLFQYSGSGYAPYFYGYYQNGVSAKYSSSKVDFMASVVTSTFNPLERDTKSLGYELGAAIKPVEGLTGKVFYLNDKKSDTDVINAWVSYSAKGFTFAGEYNTANYAGSADGNGFLLMGNYASGPFGITLRYVDFKITGDDGEGGSATSLKTNSFTISPSYKASDNLLLVAEFRKDNVKVGGPDSTQVALEALFTF
jgi:Putative beta-barrel porin-2, OmpL-like. bbp2